MALIVCPEIFLCKTEYHQDQVEHAMSTLYLYLVLLFVVNIVIVTVMIDVVKFESSGFTWPLLMRFYVFIINLNSKKLGFRF